MSEKTENLGLNLTNMNEDGNETFDFDRDLNQPFKIIDKRIGRIANLTTEQKESLVSAINEIISNLNEKPSKSLDDLNAIGQAILDRKVEVEALLEQNGYAKFSWKEDNKISNLIINWGTSTIPTGNAGIANFAISFSKSNYAIIALAELDDNNTQDFIKGFLWAHKTETNCLLRTTKSDAPTAKYIAIGT